jgi:hypothetical protein
MSAWRDTSCIFHHQLTGAQYRCCSHGAASTSPSQEAQLGRRETGGSVVQQELPGLPGYFRSIRSGRTTAPCVCSSYFARCSRAATRRLSPGLTAGVPRAAVRIVPSGSRAAATCRAIRTVVHGLLGKRAALVLTACQVAGSTLQLGMGAHPFRGDDALARLPSLGCGVTDVSIFMSENESIPFNHPFQPDPHAALARPAVQHSSTWHPPVLRIHRSLSR